MEAMLSSMRVSFKGRSSDRHYLLHPKPTATSLVPRLPTPGAAPVGSGNSTASSQPPQQQRSDPRPTEGTARSVRRPVSLPTSAREVQQQRLYCYLRQRELVQGQQQRQQQPGKHASPSSGNTYSHDGNPSSGECRATILPRTHSLQDNPGVGAGRGATSAPRWADLSGALQMPVRAAGEGVGVRVGLALSAPANAVVGAEAVGDAMLSAVAPQTLSGGSWGGLDLRQELGPWLSYERTEEQQQLQHHQQQQLQQQQQQQQQIKPSRAVGGATLGGGRGLSVAELQAHAPASLYAAVDEREEDPGEELHREIEKRRDTTIDMQQVGGKAGRGRGGH